MRLVVLDTNVVVSAGIKPGSAPARLVMDWVLEGALQAVTSPFVVDEYREVARRPKFKRYGFPPLWLEFLIEESLRLEDPPALPAPVPDPLPDPKDAPFLALAAMSGAWLVTGNFKHFPEGARGEVRVVSPAEYLGHLERGR